MNEFKIGDEVWMFGFIDGQKIGFSPEHIAIDCATLNQQAQSLPKGVTLFKSKNEAIDAMIRRVQALQDE